VVKHILAALSAQRYLVLAVLIAGAVAVETCVSNKLDEPPRAEYGTLVFEGRIDPRFELIASWSYGTSAESWFCRSGYSFAMGRWVGKRQRFGPAQMETLADERYRLRVVLEPPPKEFFDCRWFLDGPNLYIGLRDRDGHRLVVSRSSDGDASPMRVACHVTTVHRYGQEPYESHSCQQRHLRIDPTYGGTQVIRLDVLPPSATSD
jgi:hypothetical protein